MNYMAPIVDGVKTEKPLESLGLSLSLPLYYVCFEAVSVFANFLPDFYVLI